MKRLQLLMALIYSCCSCDGQIYQELNGSWLPEKYVQAIIANDTIGATEHLFPVEVIQIFKQDAIEFARTYASDLTNRDTTTVDDFILVRTYKSEFNGFSIEKVNHDGEDKYRVLGLHNGLNLKYIPLETVELYEKADIYISRSKGKLLLEVIEKGRSEKIYFVNGVGDYVFENFEYARGYLKALALKKR